MNKNTIKAQFIKQQTSMQRSLSVKSLVCIAVLIILWQLSFALDFKHLDGSYTPRDIVGCEHEHRFLYYLYYLGYYPLTTTKPLDELTYSLEGAKESLKQPEFIVTEYGHATRCGDYLKTFLFLPYAYYKGSPVKPVMKLANFLFFVFALIFLFFSFNRIKQPTLGLTVVFLVGSYPFQLFEVYRRGNIFGWPITIAVILMAINLHLMKREYIELRTILIPSILSGLIVGTAAQIRPEMISLILSVLFCYSVMSKTKGNVKYAAIFLLFISFLISMFGWRQYFQYKINQANLFLKEIGGKPYSGPRTFSHPFWHPVWCGLGDFDEKYGYEWEDYKAIRYFESTMRKRNPNFKAPNAASFITYSGDQTVFWDEEKKYYKTPALMPEYPIILRNKILSDIKNDPLWYVGIIFKRLRRAATEIPPVKWQHGKFGINIPYHWSIGLLIILLMLWNKQWYYLKIISFVLPLSTTAIFIFSGNGMVNYNIYHVMISAVFLVWLFQSLLVLINMARGKNSIN